VVAPPNCEATIQAVRQVARKAAEPRPPLLSKCQTRFQHTCLLASQHLGEGSGPELAIFSHKPTPDRSSRAHPMTSDGSGPAYKVPRPCSSSAKPTLGSRPGPTRCFSHSGHSGAQPGSGRFREIRPFGPVLVNGIFWSDADTVTGTSQRPLFHFRGCNLPFRTVRQAGRSRAGERTAAIRMPR